jgi:hypothetical protein
MTARQAVFISIAAAMVFSLSVISLSEKNKPQYIYGFFMPGTPKGDLGQLKSMGDYAAKVITGRENFTLVSKLYMNGDEFNKDVKAGAINFIYTSSKSEFVYLVRNYGYKPLFAFKYLGVMTEKYCFFANDASKYTSVKDIYHTRLVMSAYKEDYYICRKLTAADPINYFYTIKPATDIYSAFYVLKIADADVVFMSDQAATSLKTTNPGAVKDIKTIACSESYSFNPFLYSKNTPPDVVGKFRDTMLNMDKDKDFKTYWPLFKTFKIKAVEVQDADFKSSSDLIEYAEKNGWDKDFAKMKKLLDNSSQ